MATAAVKPTTPAAWEWYAGCVQTWMPNATGNGTTSRSDARCSTAFQKIPDYMISGTTLTITQVQCKALAEQLCNVLAFVVVRCPIAKTLANADAGTVERVAVATIATNFTDAVGSVKTSGALTLAVTVDTTTYNYYWGVSASTTYDAGAAIVGVYRNNAGAIGGVTQYLYYGSGWTEFPATAGACDATNANSESALGVWFTTTASVIQSIPDAACTTATTYFVARGQNGKPVTKLTGAKTGDTSALTIRFNGMNVANTAIETHISTSLTCNAGSSELLFGDYSGELSNSLPATSAAADLWNLIFSERPTGTHACELFYEDTTYGRWGQSETDIYYLCHVLQAGVGAYGYEPTLTAQDACWLRVDGGTGAYHGTIQVGHAFVDIGDSQMNLLGAAINAALASPRVHIDASVPTRCLSRDATDPVLTSIQGATYNGIGLIEGAMVAILGGYNDFGYSITTDALSAALIHRLAMSLQVIVSQLIDGGNDVILLTPFYDEQLGASAQREEWFPAWCGLVIDLARRARTTGMNLHARVRPTDGVYLGVDGIHPTAPGAALLGAMVSAEYGAGLAPRLPIQPYAAGRVRIGA